MEKETINKEVYQDVLTGLNLKVVYKTYGESTVKWALNRFLKEQRERNNLLKQKQEAEDKLKELDKKLK